MTHLADVLRLSKAYSAAMAPTRRRRSKHDPGEVLRDLVVMIAGGGVPALDVLIDKGHPVAVVVNVEEPRRRQVYGKVRHGECLVAVKPKLVERRSTPSAFTKARRPLARRTRAAAPGEYPPSCVTASTTSAPSEASTAERTCSGTCHQEIRRPIVEESPQVQFEEAGYVFN